MKLKGTRPFLSIGEFDELELPNFALIIGPNGAGKSHLLQGIENGAIHADVLGPITNMPGIKLHGVRLLRNDDPAPDGLAVGLKTEPNHLFQGEHQLSQRDFNRPSILAEVRERLLAPIQERLEEALGGSIDKLSSPSESGIRMPLAELLQATAKEGYLVSEEKVLEIFWEVDPKAETCAADLGMATQVHLARQVAQKLCLPVIALKDQEVARAGSWGAYELFDTHFVKVFSQYRDKKVLNAYWRAAGGDVAGRALSDEEFVARWGGPPWERVSQALTAFGLPYRVKEPSMDPAREVYFQLERSDGILIDFGHLSSGEKTLIRFALSTFQVDEVCLNVSVPLILLLDEIDASLHPENVHRLLNAIQTGLVEKMNVTVIMTTHSPTTVALAPPNAMFEMTNEIRVPRPITKQQALNRLTVGLPMLSVDYSGRRQVFVESSVDASQYDRIANLLKAKLDLPRTLTFISAGGSEGGDSRGGCTIVTRIVSELARSGVKSLYGIVDWDGKNKPADAIKVLAYKTHYTKENLLLDPLLVAILLLLDKPSGVRFPISLSQIPLASPSDLQDLSDVVLDKLALAGEASTNQFLGGLRLTLPKIYQQMKGHDLEDQLTAAFPSLKRYSGSGKWLTDPVIDRVLTEFPQFCPSPLASIFQEIATEMPE